MSPPGETITDLLEEKDWTQLELAGRLGYTTKHLNQLIKGKAALTEDAALRLERVLGSTANFWLNREAKYREHLARIEVRKLNQKSIAWLDKLPLNELKKVGVIPNRRITAQAKPELVEQLLRFFGVASTEQWQAHYETGMQGDFRRTRESQSDMGAISSWLRLGEIEAEKLDGANYNRSKFEKALRRIRKLTVQPPEIFEPEMRRLCHDAGVLFVMVPAIPKAHVSGVARWLNKHKPLIQLSLYGKTNDKFWFTFFHEAAHILLHEDGKKTIYLDDLNADCKDPQEKQANSWAREFLIPSDSNDRLLGLRSKKDVKCFSEEIGIHPGIIVGRLQHDKIIEPSWMNDLKETFKWVESQEQDA
ncbi:ImmA/IrrE family metallo-endopeptidase [Methylovulum psychrotolerans]|uniref:ImmA/IrrE family metallo-endopeptidase n=1 Tax=Methylovulum psychrotolerans TaxID=1704499 RepID=UPI0032F0502D